MGFRNLFSITIIRGCTRELTRYLILKLLNVLEVSKSCLCYPVYTIIITAQVLEDEKK